MKKWFLAVIAAGALSCAGASSAEVWYVPGWNRTTETNGLAYTSCTNVFKGKVCAFWGWDGDRSWSTSAANADVAAKRLAAEIAATNEAFRSELVIVGHSLGGRIVARTLAELSRRGVKVGQGILLAPAIPMNDPDVAQMGGGCVRPVIVVVNPKDAVLKYCYDMVGGEGGPALGRNGSPIALANVVEYAVPNTITNETKIDAAWGRSETVKRVCNHLAAFYFTELRRILDGKPSKSAQVRVPQVRLNLEWKVIDAGLWWDVLDTCGGWKLERNIVTGHCRIISPERKRAAWGPEAQMRTSFSKIRAQLAAKVSTGIACADMVKSLAGEWRVTGDNLSGVVHLPGTLADAKLGRHMTAADWEKDTNRASKGALTREYQYTGKAVYEREIELTEEEARYPLELVMERVMLHSELAIDGESLGSCDSLAVEHVYPIPPRLTKPGRHTIRLTLDNSNRYNFSEWAHSYGPVMQSVWHGVVGEFALRRQSPLRQSRVFASWPANHRLVVEVPESFKTKDLDGNIRLLHANAVPPDCNSVRVRSIKPSPYRRGFNLIELFLEYEPEAWSEHHPYLYSLVLHDVETDFTHTIRFGFRSVSAHDHAIWINGFKWFMRGNLDCCHFPLTGAPETSVEWWRTTFRKLRNQDGINTIRFHSWTPPKAAFDAADELGMFCVVEAGIWVDRWHTTADKMGFGKPIDGFVQHELRNILEKRGNSPSFISLGIGNELGGSDFKVMGKWMNDCRAFDPSRLYLASTAREISPGDDYTTTHRHPEVGMVRARFKPSTDWDYEDVYGKTRLPVVAHEIGQWPIYVDWKHELAKYTGVMRPYNLEHYRDVAVKSGTERFWPRFCKASTHLNRLMYKDEVESFMRTPSCAGLQLLSVQDFTGQFEAMIGWRDSFYDLKPSVYEFSRPFFKTIFRPYAGLSRFGKYVWSVGETYKATILVRNGTEEPSLEGEEWNYYVEDRPTLDAFGESYLHGRLRLSKTIYPGDVGVLGEVSIPLTADMAGKKFMLRFNGNYWPFWVFGRAVAPRPPNPILETSSFDEAVAALARGGRVLYTGKSAHCAKSHFKPVYWSTGHFKSANAELSTLGYLVQCDHPALRGFPTEDWADWQWYNLVEGGVKHGIVGLPQGIDPIVMPVPDLHYSTKMGVLFELKVGTGRLMVCGLNFSDKSLPEVCAVRKSVLAYMESNDFNPTASIEMEKFKEVFAPQATASKLRPAQFRDAPVYIAAAVELDAAERSVDWKKSLDFAEMKQGGYNVSGKGRWGSWRDSSGSFWHGQNLTVTLTDARPVNGTLWVRFRDPNRNNRSGRGTCEGRPFTIPKHQNAKDGIFWAKLPVMREDFLDGKLEITCEAVTGPNLMIDRVVLMADK